METIIPKNIIEGANNNSFFERGSGMEREAQNESGKFEGLEDFARLEKRLGGFTDEQRGILKERAAGWRDLVKEQYTEKAAFNANNVPWYIAGPANYPAARYNKRLEASERKFETFEEKKQRYIKNTLDMLKKATPAEVQVRIWAEGRQGYGEIIDAADPLAVEKMEAHIAHMERVHAQQVVFNAYIRKNGTAKGCPGIPEGSAEKIDAELARCPYRRHKFFFTDQDQANIRNKLKRLEILKKHRAIAEEEKAEGLKVGVLEKDGLRVENNHEAARVQLFFDGKPDDDTRGRLKANGFRWSPRFSAWQRQNTPNGMRVAKMLFDAWDGEKFRKLNVFAA